MINEIRDVAVVVGGEALSKILIKEKKKMV
jgi:hypothetical protein